MEKKCYIIYICIISYCALAGGNTKSVRSRTAGDERIPKTDRQNILVYFLLESFTVYVLGRVYAARQRTFLQPDFQRVTDTGDTTISVQHIRGIGIERCGLIIHVTYLY